MRPSVRVRPIAARLAGCCALAAAFAAPAFAQLPWWELVLPPTVRLICPPACAGFKTCRQNQYTACSSINVCVCRRVPPTGVIPP